MRMPSATSTRSAPLPRALLLLLALALPVAAQQDEETTTDEPRETAAGPSDAAELEAFVDGFMNAYLDSGNLAGATVSVVRGGELVLAKGYGFADVEERHPVDPARTLFRIGSVSKLFVWISVMQLVEQGRLDLDTDVNEYLTDLEVPRRFDAPITLANLMTHTPGFEDRVLGLFSHDESSLRPLGDILREEMPHRVRPPGDLASYSNHGTGLAMHVVEQVSGQPWQDYIVEHILQPLGLEQTTFSQPLPPKLDGDMSKGYRFAGGELEEQEFELVPLGPVGGASASATDMARFMTALLHGGELEGARILSPETVDLMFSELHRQEPGVAPMAHGFIDMSRNGQRVVGHGGDTIWFHSLFALFPEHDLGLFASINTSGSGPSALYEAFVDRYFPVPEPMPQRVDVDLGRFTGLFRANRFDHSNITKLGALFGTLPVTLSEEGDALVTPGARLTRWVPVGPLTMQEEHGALRLVFRENEAGEITHAFRSDLPIIAFERVPAAESPRLNAAVLAACLSTFLLALLYWPAAFVVRRHYKVRLEKGRRLPAGARWSAWTAALLFLAFAIGMALSVGDPMQVVFGLPGSVKTLLALPLLAALVSLAALASAFSVWRRGHGRLVGRLAYSWVVLACLAFLLQLAVWNQLGFRF